MKENMQDQIRQWFIECRLVSQQTYPFNSHEWLRQSLLHWIVLFTLWTAVHWFELSMVTLSQLTFTLALLKGTRLKLCPEMHEIMKMADLTKFYHTKWMFMDLMILLNFIQICRSKISFTGLTILTNFSQIFQGKISLADSMLWQIFVIFIYLQHAFLDISLHLKLWKLIFSVLRSLKNTYSWVRILLTVCIVLFLVHFCVIWSEEWNESLDEN